MQNRLKLILFSGGIVLLAVLAMLFFVVFPQSKTTTTPDQIPTPTRIGVTTYPNPQNQGEADINFSNQVGDLYTAYPWYNQLPFQTPEYFVYFDPPSKKFIAKIYDKTKNLTPEQTQQFKLEVTTKIAGLGSNASTFPVDWQTGL